jgi:methionine-gamma-lyase
MQHGKWHDSIEERRLHPESLMMGYGYRPEWSEGAVKSPIFQTSTFAFTTAEEGKHFFELAYGLADAADGEQMGMIYSRLNNPDLEILEDRLTLWDDAEKGLVFSSGMAAIATTLLAYLRPGDILLHSGPLYGGTDHLVAEILPTLGITTIGYDCTTTRSEIEERLYEAEQAGHRLGMVFMETPANPTNDLIDIAMGADIAASRTSDERRPLVVVDNTFLGPVFQHPLALGADLVIYSATKYIGGHSDLIAGACVGSEVDMAPIAAMRTFLGTMASPWTGWLMMRSLETLSLRMKRQTETAARVAEFLVSHPKIAAVHYLGLLDAGHPQYELYKRQCLAPGGMVAFEFAGGEEEAFRFLNALEMVKIAVSLGGTESLAQHPATMTHAGMDPVERDRLGVTSGLVRLSVGVEHPEDLITDLGHALRAV